MCWVRLRRQFHARKGSFSGTSMNRGFKYVQAVVGSVLRNVIFL
jgi:hypothetical protein